MPSLTMVNLAPRRRCATDENGLEGHLYNCGRGTARIRLIEIDSEDQRSMLALECRAQRRG